MQNHTTRNIKHEEDLPKWFNINNYRELKNFSFDQWVSVIGERYTMNQIFEGRGITQLESLQFTPDQVFGEAITAARYPANIQVDPRPFTKSSVKSLSFKDVLLFEPKISFLADHPDIQQVTGTDSDTSVEFSGKPYDLVMQNTGRHNSPDAHVVIDLSASDKQILKDIQTWLTEYRIASNRPAASNAHYFEDRQRYWDIWRVIPYLDLYLWAKFSGKSIANILMARVIFSDFELDYKIAIDKLSTATKPNADILLTEIGWNSLHTIEN